MKPKKHMLVLRSESDLLYHGCTSHKDRKSEYNTNIKKVQTGEEGAKKSGYA